MAKKKMRDAAAEDGRCVPRLCITAAFGIPYPQIIETARDSGPGVKFCVSDFRQKSRMGLESRADFGLNPLVTESHGGQNGMRAGTA